MKIELVAIGKVKPNKENPRVIQDEKFDLLVNSVKEFPKMLEIRPIVVNDDMIVLGGNMRLKACKEAGLKKIHIIKASDLTEEQQKEFIIKDNVGFGKWDYDQLNEEWDKNQLEDWGMDLPELDEIELEAVDDNYEMPPKSEMKSDVVLGDLVEIGPHRLLCGSSTEMDTWEKLMKDELCDIVVTDPPYNVDYTGGTGLKIENDSMGDADFYQFLYDFYTALGSFTKPGGGWYVWHADSEGANFRRAMIDAGLLLKQCLIWVKSSLVMGRQDYHWKHEPCLEGGKEPETEEEYKTHQPCLYGWKPGAAHNWYSDRKQTTILEFDKPSKNGEHPTMKPVELIAYQIGNNSLKGELVADGFLGSGTTMVAAHQLERKCYGMELDPKYCQVIIDRMMQLDESLTVKINGKKYKKSAK